MADVRYRKKDDHSIVVRPGAIVGKCRTYAGMRTEAWDALGYEPFEVGVIETPVEPVVVQYSKYKVIVLLKNLGLLPTFLDWLDGSDRTIKAEWDACLVIEENNPTFSAAIEMLGSVLNKTTEDIRALLVQCIA